MERRLPWMLSLFYLLFFFSASANSVGKRFEEIHQSCKTIDSSLKNSTLTPRFFAVLSPRQPGLWNEFHSAEDFQMACSKGYSQKATAYSNGPEIVLVSFELKSPSKEWVHFLKYYFRDDGTLEKIHSDFRRFGAYQKEKGSEQQFLVKVLRERFYDTNGKCIKKSSARCFNMSTGGEVKNVVFTDVSWPSYMRVEKLPFYSLIQPPSTPTPTKP